MRHILSILAICVTLSACGGGAKKPQPAAELKIDIPKAPAVVTDPAEMVGYTVEHYWDNMNFADTAYVEQEVTEQAFAGYLYLLQGVPHAEALSSLDRLMTSARANSAMYAYFLELAERYLYDPNSPYRDEEQYVAVLENVVSWDSLDDLLKLRPRSQLKMALKNRIGEPATDLNITLSSGRTMNLYDIKSDYILLYFNNPDCSACDQLTAELTRSSIVSHLVQSKEMTVVTVYPDEDLTAWRAHLAVMPAGWINGYDSRQKIRNEDVYDLRAIPSLYLLDKDKRVLMKDEASVQQIEAYFRQALYGR